MNKALIINFCLMIGLVGCGNGGEKMTQEQARKIAENTCIKGGEALGLGIYDSSSKTWWFDANLNAEREGCNPACVVSVESKKAEIDWRCVGLDVGENQGDNFSLGNTQLDLAVREYLQAQEVFSWQTMEGSKNICVFEKLDNYELFPHYLWVRCGEFVRNGGTLEEKSGSSLPAKIDYPNELSFFDIHRFAYEIPRDGSLYTEDIKNIFPDELHDLLFGYDASRINERVKLVAKNELEGL